ncbi:hypothetical protein OPT61_g3162 [Boeremia exigua]|uniref:Uncharacterized protein n=1 Tax=Boeremia exigua TaxID=749465 RepID=A0ACC2IIX4_9PLEO|nr:hypothetical protein OPT61_g3162 [Boeremia exigua]
MPPILRPASHGPGSHEVQTAIRDRSIQDVTHNELDAAALQAQSETLSRLYRQTTTRSIDHAAGLPEAHRTFRSFLRERDPTGWYPEHRGVCFDKLTTYGITNDDNSAKTLLTALWRTLTAKDIYESTFQRLFTSTNSTSHRAIISNISGVVRGGEMVLVLGNPGSGCSTFLRTVGNQHSNFTKVEGLLSFSGLSSEEVTKSYRGEVAYVPEEDEHIPTLTVRQTLSFVLRSKVPQRFHDEISDYLDMYGKVFGMSHVFDTPVGNDYVRGISGGERKRVSIMETLAVDSAVIAWDNSTRGLDAASAVKYAQSLRILTDVTQKATFVTLYQASDAILNLMDKIMVLDKGKMVYQGPVGEAQNYFEHLGYYRHPRQTLADFLTSVTSPSQRQFREGAQDQAPKGSEALEKAFHQSDQFQNISQQIKAFRDEMCSPAEPINKKNSENPFKATAATRKSKYVPSSSSYSTAFPLQIRLCMQREWWQLRQHLYPIYVRLAIVVIVAFLLGSMFYDMPKNTQGIYSRGGFIFYAAIAIGWVQLAELEGAMDGRGIIARHKQQAIARPSVVGLSKVCFDVLIVFAEALVFGIIAYFLAGMRAEFLVPVRYGFESIMAAEFTGVSFGCDQSRRVPRGPLYQGVTVTCAVPGAEPGEMTVDGGQYLLSYYGFTYRHVWRNFGIILGMSIAYILITMYFLEHFDWSSGASGAHGIERIGKQRQRRTDGQDLEGQPTSAPSAGWDAPDEAVEAPRIAATDSIFTWRNVVYTIPYAKSEKALLQDVSGYCKPGELTALVGASGAGKSTLLTVLASRQNSGNVSGQITVNGAPVGPSYVKDIGFCPQGDIHDETSTIQEAFVFSALLRQHSAVSEKDKIAYTENVLETLGLNTLRNAVIGSLSLEAKRRTSIGVELCAKPKLLLFLDEPTSGLDSQGALTIVKLLRKLANGGQAILCTIHQASHEQFTLFDRVLALNPGGTTFYNGPIGKSGQSVFEYFGKHGCTAEESKNVADFIIEVGTGTVKPPDNHDIDWSAAWSASHEAKNVLETIDRLCDAQSADPNDTFTGSSFSFSTSIFYQSKLLTLRNLRQFYRIAEYTYARLYASFIHAAFNGLTFLQLDNSASSLQATAYSLFLILMLVPEFINSISMRFIANRNIWLEKELPSRTYGWFAFATSQIIAEIPYALIGAVVFYVIFYFMVGHPLGVPAWFVFLMTVAFHLFATNWGQWIAAMSPDAMTAANLMPFFITMCELFNGILQPPEQMPAFWRYTMHYVTPFTYWVAGTLGIVLRDRPVTCNEGELIFFPLSTAVATCGEYAEQFLASASGYLSNPAAQGEGTLCGYCQYITGADVSSQYYLPVAVPANVKIAVPFYVWNLWVTSVEKSCYFPWFRWIKLHAGVHAGVPELTTE